MEQVRKIKIECPFTKVETAIEKINKIKKLTQKLKFILNLLTKLPNNNLLLGRIITILI